MKNQKIAAGHYVYRDHHIYLEDTHGPEGGQRRYWSVSGKIGGPDENYAHADLPQLNTLRAAMDWVDTYLDGGNAMQIAHENQPQVWGA